MRLLYYPPQTGEVDDRIEGIGAHTELVISYLILVSPFDKKFTVTRYTASKAHAGSGNEADICRYSASPSCGKILCPLSKF